MGKGMLFSLLLLVAGMGQVKAEIISTCPEGYKYQGSICYQPCRDKFIADGPACRKKCKSDYTWTGVSCSKWYGTINYYPESYIRGTEVPRICSSRSFTRDIPTSADPETFTMIFASDLQFPWWRGGKDPACNSEKCVLKKSKEVNGDLVQSMNNIVNASYGSGNNATTGVWPATSHIVKKRRGAPIPDPEGVVINGDLTAFWHDWQTELYMDFYHRNDADPLNPRNLKLDIYPGLGNHDYANNKSDCTWKRNLEYLTYGLDGCAKNAAHYIKKTLNCDLVPNFPKATITSFDESSLAYSWDIGHYHFIQLHNYPAYRYSEIGLTDAMEWFRQDLETAHNAGKRIVVNLHDYGDHMKEDNAEFLKALAGRNVVALFAGHIHKSNGYLGNVPGLSIPVFRSGSADYSTFLLAEFASGHMTVAVMESFDGRPVFHDPYNHSKTRTFYFNNQAP